MSRRPYNVVDPRVPTLVFSPYDGFRLDWTATRELYREHHPELPWRFNPWSGEPRHPSDIESDPKGFLIWDNAWGPLLAAADRDPRFDKTIGAAPIPRVSDIVSKSQIMAGDKAAFATEYKRIMSLDECRAAEGAQPQPGEADPTGRDAHAPGAKMDAGKPRVWLCVSGFSRALGAVAEVTTRGAEKYAPNSWMEVPEGVERYMEGFARHALALGRGETHDTGPGGTGCLHKAQMIWNLLASLELELELRAGGTA